MNSAAPVPRGVRVGTEIAHVLAELLERRCDDPRLRLVTVTGSRMSPDLKQARVWVSSADPGTDTEAALAALRHAGHRLRRELAARMRLRSAPRLEFAWDTRGEEAMHLETLIARGLPASDEPAAEPR